MTSLGPRGGQYCPGWECPRHTRTTTCKYVSGVGRKKRQRQHLENLKTQAEVVGFLKSLILMFYWFSVLVKDTEKKGKKRKKSKRKHPKWLVINMEETMIVWGEAEATSWAGWRDQSSELGTAGLRRRLGGPQIYTEIAMGKSLALSKPWFPHLLKNKEQERA